MGAALTPAMSALHHLSSVLSARHAPSWILLTMAAGGVNAGAFLACQRFVTHVTGSGTLVGMSARSWHLVLDYLILFVCFVLGAMTSVLAIEGSAHRGRPPRHALPLLVVAALLSLVAVGGATGCFGPFGGEPAWPADLVLLALLAFAMGLQNAAVASATGQVVRTTHLTGPVTDLGVHLATSLLTTGERRRGALRLALLRAGKVLGFIGGAALMVPTAGVLGFWAFLAPAVLVLLATGLSFVPTWSGPALPGLTAQPVD